MFGIILQMNGRIVIKHKDKYICSIYRKEIVYGNHIDQARLYKTRNHVDSICKDLKLKKDETEIIYVSINDDGSVRALS